MHELPNGTVVSANPSGIEGRVGRINALELQAAVAGIPFEEGVGVARLPLRIGGQRRKESAEPLSGA